MPEEFEELTELESLEKPWRGEFCLDSPGEDWDEVAQAILIRAVCPDRQF